MQIPRRKSEEFRKRDTGPIYLTEEGLNKLREELEHLKRVLPNRISETQIAAAFGDRSENAAYQVAKASLRRTNWQILSINEQLKRVEIIVPGANSSGTVQLGSTVVLEADGKEVTFQIVGPRETDPAHGRVSHLSPLGAALMNRTKGDAVTIKTENGSRKYRIISIR